MRSGLLRSIVVGFVLVTARGAHAETNVCARDGDLLYAAFADRAGPAKPASTTQAGVDALGDTGARAVSLHDLMSSNRVCPVSDFSALSRAAALTAILALPTECLPAFARTARLPGLVEIEVMCGDGTAVDVEQLLAFPSLERVRLALGCRHGSGGLAPLAGLAHLRTLVDDGGTLDGLERLTSLRGLGIRSIDGHVAQIAKLTALRALSLTVHAPPDLTPLRELRAIEQLAIQHERVGAVDVGPLAPLTSLKRLALRSQGITHGEVLGRLTALCVLEVDRRSFVDPAWLAGLRRLEVLRISAVEAPSLAPLARMRALTEVALESGCTTVEVDLAPLARLPRLASVSLTGAMLIRNGARLGDKLHHTPPRHCGHRP